MPVPASVLYTPTYSRSVTVHSTLTRLLQQAREGDLDALESLFATSYRDLCRIARARLRGHDRPTLLDTGSLVHESYIRFAESAHLTFEGRVHFLRWVGRAMRSIIVDFARRKLAERRGAGALRVPLEAEPAGSNGGEEEILGVHRALDRLAGIDPRLARVVEMRYFAGMTDAEIGISLGITDRTVRRDWQKARLLLQDALA